MAQILSRSKWRRRGWRACENHRHHTRASRDPRACTDNVHVICEGVWLHGLGRNTGSQGLQALMRGARGCKVART